MKECGHLVARVVAGQVREDARGAGQHVDIVGAQLGDQDLQKTVQPFLKGRGAERRDEERVRGLERRGEGQAAR